MDIQRWRERRHITYCRAAVPMMQSNKVEHSTNTAKRPGNTSTFSNKLSGNETTNRIVKENNFAYNHAVWVSLCSPSALPRWQCFTLWIAWDRCTHIQVARGRNAATPATHSQCTHQSPPVPAGTCMCTLAHSIYKAQVARYL